MSIQIRHRCVLFHHSCRAQSSPYQTGRSVAVERKIDLHSRDRVPVPEADVGAAFVATGELVQEQAQLWFGGQTASFDAGVRREVVARSHDWPVVRNLHRDGAVQRANLNQVSYQKFTSTDVTTDLNAAVPLDPARWELNE